MYQKIQGDTIQKKNTLLDAQSRETSQSEMKFGKVVDVRTIQSQFRIFGFNFRRMWEKGRKYHTLRHLN